METKRHTSGDATKLLIDGFKPGHGPEIKERFESFRLGFNILSI
jgi:hypothetical protein